MTMIQPDALIDFVERIFRAVGAPEESARLVARSLVTSNLAGHDSHGVVRVVQYLRSIADGEMDPRATPTLDRDTAVISTVDGHWGFGQVAANYAMTVSIRKAGEQGLAATSLYNCGHVGRLGEWVQMAADARMIGLAFCNGGRPGGIVAPFGGAGRLLGTNPIAAAAPVPDRPPVVIDFATSVVAEGKVRIARNKGETIPEGWILDAEGNPSTHPEDLYAGGVLLTAAGHKGYGLSLLVELLGGVLTGAGCPALPDGKLGNGIVFLVLNIDEFRSFGDFMADAGKLMERTKSVPAAPGFSEVLLPGEPEQRSTRRRRETGIPVDDTTWSQLVHAASRHHVSAPPGL
jgi:uncharacterized oxidoreductase